MTNGMAAGVKMGAYHFAHPDVNATNAGAIAEANYFLSVAKSYIVACQLPPALDWETSNSLTSAQQTAWVQNWINTVQAATGITPIIYSASSFASTLGSSLHVYPLWIANPGTSATTPPTNLAGWSTWAIKQYSFTGTVSGIPGGAGGTDLNIFNGNQAAFDAFIGCNTVATLDAGVPNITKPSGTSCSTTFSPIITVKNFGSTTLTSCTINYHYDANPNLTQPWSGSLATGASVAFTLPSMTVTAGTHTLTCSSSNPNGSTDGNLTNDQSQSTFNVTTSPAALPLTEGFESAATLPSGWSLWNPDNDAAWEISTTVAHTGTKCIGFNNCLGNGSGNDMTGRKDRFITSPYDFTNATSATLSFDVAYGVLTSGKTYTDSLAIFSSTDCGTTWNQIYLKGGNALSTASTTVTQPCWAPTSTDWRTDNVSLSNLAGQANVLFAFEDRSDWGEWIYLDNINISTATGIQETNNNQFQIYPNPSNGTFNVQWLTANGNTSTMDAYNVFGEKVFTSTINQQASTIDMSNQPNGIYFLQIKSDMGSSTKKTDHSEISHEYFG